MSSTLRRIQFVLLSVLLCFCESKDTESNRAEPVYHKSNSEKKLLLVGVPNQSYYDAFEPVIKILNERLSFVQFRLVASITYDEYIGRIEEGSIDMFFTNGLVALENEKKNYSIVAKFGDDSTYYSAIVSRKDALLSKESDLKGKKIGISGKGSILGELAPMVYLHERAGEYVKSMKKIYYPGFESSILNVYLGKCDVAGVWAAVLKSYLATHPEIGKAVEVKWKTKALPNIALIMNKSIDDNLKEKIVNEFIKVHEIKEGFAAFSSLGITRMERANSDSYQELLQLKAQYNSLVSGD